MRLTLQERSAIAEAREIEPRLTLSTFAPLVQHIPPTMRDRVLAAAEKRGRRHGIGQVEVCGCRINLV